MIQSQKEQAGPPDSGASATGGKLPKSQELSSISAKAASSSATPKLKGKDFFSSTVWKHPESTSTFNSFIASLRKKIRNEVKQTTAAHRFIRTLRDSRRLVRCYTQNFDGLETREGLCVDLNRGKGSRARFSRNSMKVQNIPEPLLPGGNADGGCEVVQLHGDLLLLRCDICCAKLSWEEEGREALLLDGKAPVCLLCHMRDQERRGRGKRGTTIGSLRPDIVLYDETHPEEDAIGAISKFDLQLVPDVLLILGTSLHVYGLRNLVKEFAKVVHGKTSAKRKVIFVNLTKPSESAWKGVIDYWISMDCDEWVSSLRQHRPDLWPVQIPLELEVKKTDVHLPEDSKLNKKQVEKDDGKENRTESSSSSLTSGLERPLAHASSRRPLQAVLNESSKPLPAASSTISSTRKLAKSTQLPTPPPSGHRNRIQNTSSKRPRSVEEEAPMTPSKRAKKGAVQIWQD